ncbi:hypothetical protein AZE42_07557 [Rhizopogon vesiculosus]|uniref:Uncharacterized protein n=1 Tax=Rhizopogon vesiculosus TaxID=180088 RepID=A0A1J8Q7W4_9AGAM|nr:hypothetical protein AZE42_07557 [Rhizopogon vesiculosus]
MSLSSSQVPLESISIEVHKHDSQDIPLQGLKSEDAQPTPHYRHAAPSGPWPWMDFRNVDVTTAKSEEPKVDTTWRGYPQSLFGNWTPDQVKRSQMLEKCSKNRSSSIYWLDVLDTGKFTTPDMDGNGHTSTVTSANENEFWNILQAERPGNIRVRSLFVDDLSSPVLKMLGTRYGASFACLLALKDLVHRYNIEPFFFTSSINWIPSRYQEALIHGKGDHITITLPFVRTPKSQSFTSSPRSPPIDNKINTQAPLHMSSMSIVILIFTFQPPLPIDGDVLFIDLLAIHMVRDKESTIISYHPEPTPIHRHHSTLESSSISSAKRLHSLMRLVGDSVYWQSIFSKSDDPTLLFVAVLWYALYTWDETLESLHNYVMPLESDVLTESRVEHTRDLHTLQAYLLFYESLLHGFQLSVSFIEKTPNPAMHREGIYEEKRKVSNELMKKECENLLSEIDRLQKRRDMLSKQLKNVMDLAFANVNIRDSASMRQVVPPSSNQIAAPGADKFLFQGHVPDDDIPTGKLSSRKQRSSSVFGMNVKEINPGSLETLVRYIQITIALTALTFYVVVTLQTHTSFHERGAPLHKRAAWPVILPQKILRKMKRSPSSTQKARQANL